jgi:NAD(P)-dependent dehydrogenase (short-subunit alcohol dehydrogenase family)
VVAHRKSHDPDRPHDPDRRAQHRRATTHGRAPAAFITGAGGGLGAAFARRLAADGARLTLVDADAERLAAVAGPIATDGVQVQVLVVDLAVPGAAQHALDAAVDHWGAVDLVVPFAGIFVEPAAPVTPALRRLLRAVNLHHPLEVAELALRRAEERGQACTVVMPLSDAGLKPRDPWVYARAKAELHARTHHLVNSWRHHPDMRVVRAVVYPTLTDFAVNSDALMEARLGGLPGNITDHSGLEALMTSGARPDAVAGTIIDAVAERRRWIYLEPRDGYWRWRAWATGELFGPLLDRMPRTVRERLKLLPRIEVTTPDSAVTVDGPNEHEARRSA